MRVSLLTLQDVTYASHQICIDLLYKISLTNNFFLPDASAAFLYFPNTAFSCLSL